MWKVILFTFCHVRHVMLELRPEPGPIVPPRPQRRTSRLPLPGPPRPCFCSLATVRLQHTVPLVDGRLQLLRSSATSRSSGGQPRAVSCSFSPALMRLLMVVVIPKLMLYVGDLISPLRALSEDPRSLSIFCSSMYRRTSSASHIFYESSNSSFCVGNPLASQLPENPSWSSVERPKPLKLDLRSWFNCAIQNAEHHFREFVNQQIVEQLIMNICHCQVKKFFRSHPSRSSTTAPHP